MIDESRIEHFMAFLRGIANMLSETGLRRLRELREKTLIWQGANSAIGPWCRRSRPWCGQPTHKENLWFLRIPGTRTPARKWEDHRDDGWMEMFHPDDRATIQGLWENTVRLGAPYESPGRIWSASLMEFRHFVARAVPICNDDGIVQEWVGTITDVHDKKIAEEALKERNAAVEEANKELAYFAYVASHDLREPLRKISNFTELLGKRYQGQFDEKADRYIYYIVDGARRMQQLIDDLLTFSRISRAEIVRESIELESVLEITLNDLDKFLTDAGAEVTHDPLPVVQANRTQMGQLLQNFIVNAVKFRTDELPRVHVSAQKDGKEWRISVRDNGIGLDMEHAERIFGIFQRLHGRSEYEGTGIGLAVCKKIVERHGGRIWVESEIGKGATFVFSLPVTQ